MSSKVNQNDVDQPLDAGVYCRCGFHSLSRVMSKSPVFQRRLAEPRCVSNAFKLTHCRRRPNIRNGHRFRGRIEEASRVEAELMTSIEKLQDVNSLLIAYDNLRNSDEQHEITPKDREAHRENMRQREVLVAKISDLQRELKGLWNQRRHLV